MAQLQPIYAINVEKVVTFPVASITIATSATDSNVITTNCLALTGIQMPTAFDGTTLYIEGSIDGSVFQPVNDAAPGGGAGGQLLTVAASQFIAIDPIYTHGLRYIKLITSSAQTADRQFQLALKGF